MVWVDGRRSSGVVWSRWPSGRGYGYVAISRFSSRLGCHLYGRIRRTDFLPVGEDRDDEVLEREIVSAKAAVLERHRRSTHA